MAPLPEHMATRDLNLLLALDVLLHESSVAAAAERLNLSRSAMSRVTDLVAHVAERQTERAREGIFTFALPVSTEPVVVAQIWHPRSERDPAHRWLRSCVK
jgi:DNA-binding transcriptional LysR family regulator